MPVLAAATGIGLLIAGLLTAGFDEERKMRNGVNYIAEVERGKAYWYTRAGETDEWTRHFLGDAPENAPLPDWVAEPLTGARGTYLLHPAPLARTEPPRARLLEATGTRPEHWLRLRVTPSPGAYSTLVRFPDDAGVELHRIDGRDIPEQIPLPGIPQASQPELRFYGSPPDGVEIEFSAIPNTPLKLILRSDIPGLPPTEEGSRPVRPDHMMTAGPWMDLTRLQRSIEL